MHVCIHDPLCMLVCTVCVCVHAHATELIWVQIQIMKNEALQLIRLSRRHTPWTGAEQRFRLGGGAQKCSGGSLINILSHNKTIVAVNATSNMIGHITPNVSINSTV